MAHDDDERRGMSRREFIKSTGLTTLALRTGALAGIVVGASIGSVIMADFGCAASFTV
jgi:hypothetical protein